MKETDKRILKRGLKRVLMSLATTIAFLAALYGFYLVAVTEGYVAVLTFIFSLMILGYALVLLYAQGITRKSQSEGQGEDK